MIHDKLKRTACVAVTSGLLLMAGCVSGPGPKETKQANIQYDMAVNDLKSGQLTDALKGFLEVVEINPDFAQARYGLGLVYHLLGDYEKALSEYRRALDLKPDYVQVLNSMARVHISQGNYRFAVPLLEKALDDVFLPERYLTEANLGWALFHIGETKKGFVHVRAALALNENFCVGYEYMGLMFQEQRKYEQAVREFRELVKRCPDYTRGHQRLGKVLLMSGQLAEGCRELKLCRERSRMTEVGSECDRLFDRNCSRKGDSYNSLEKDR